MLRSMYSGISGLKAQQTKLDVVGNNIANANTTAFKSQSIRFQDMLSQNMSQATGPSANIGGSNPRQVGLGVQVAGIFTKFTTGNMQTTGNKLDAAIDGSGFFVVGRGPLVDGASDDYIAVDSTTHEMTANKNMEIMFTRDGSFSLDSQGNLLTGDGLRVFGYENTSAKISYSVSDSKKQNIIEKPSDLKAEPTFGDVLKPLTIPDSIGVDPDAIRIQSFSIGKDGVITASLVSGDKLAIGQIAMASFKNDAGLEKMGRNAYQVSANSGDPMIRSKNGATANDNSKGYGNMLQSMIEMSNVDLAEEFTEMIVANRAFQACGKMITTGDEILQELVNLKR
ncbi:TPA: flagellar hook-basal body complex protein [Clostridium botulinum]|uniref:Flagellar hook protein FlgE n=1 Tax=Clostridium sporogenes TaxID=1509 RepID=A0A2K9MSX4_CLOSG|nr:MULTISPECIES: flagellar hook-basal body complex protein [Clostridium]AKC63452.1 flagellar basal-body rod protein FlgG [Clostridium sporogenes]AKJ90622.1 flagellar hook protein FlgE [Clostridium sporogenes]AUM96451.1 flagellar biosynthesis protein FlgE [Clostridium sporogenes]AVP60202.1 flagellar hook protein FlgE [Clostridium botulinum]AVQ53902.1 flagellar hook protein FlgE [Clostridium botulinum]